MGEARSQNGLGVPFLHLPPSVLLQILAYDGVLTSMNLSICKALLPVALEALYISCELDGRPQIARFAAALIHKPKLRDLLSDSLSFAAARPFDPLSVTVGAGLLQDLFRSMPRLRQLHLWIKPLLSTLLSQAYLASNPLPRVRSLLVSVCRNEPWGGPGEMAFCLRLQMLPALRVFAFVLHDNPQLPLALLNVDTSTRLPSRSWDVESVQLSRGACIGPEARHLFAAFSDLRRLLVNSNALAPAFPSDLALLPSTLRALTLQIGPTCPDYDREAILPKLDSLAYFHNLEHLHISGDIVTYETYESLPRLPRLRCLLLGRHTLLDAPEFASFLDFNSPSSLSSLELLTLNVCRCPDASPAPTTSKKRSIRWPTSLSLADGRELAKRCQTIGIHLRGTIADVVAKRPTKSLKQSQRARPFAFSFSSTGTALNKPLARCEGVQRHGAPCTSFERLEELVKTEPNVVAQLPREYEAYFSRRSSSEAEEVERNGGTYGFQVEDAASAAGKQLEIA
ncbi:hypothetical protein JCM10213v2_005570 [Rhodosporidiobolus nylandii]